MATILPASHADKIQWLNDILVWVVQLSLPKEKIEAASSLVQEQLEAGHLVESQSPWNTPIFVITAHSGLATAAIFAISPGILIPISITAT